MAGTEILVVDDELAICDLLAEILNQNGYKCQSTGSGKEALDYLARHPFDLVLLDIKMPGMSGLEVLDVIGQSYPGIPVIMITAVNDASTAVTAMKNGASDYILKPFAVNDVINRVTEAIRLNLSSLLAQIPVADRLALEKSRMEAIALGVDAQLGQFDFHDRIVTERTVEVARQLNIPREDIDRWLAVRQSWLAARARRISLVMQA